MGKADRRRKPTRRQKEAAYEALQEHAYRLYLATGGNNMSWGIREDVMRAGLAVCARLAGSVMSPDDCSECADQAFSAVVRELELDPNSLVDTRLVAFGLCDYRRLRLSDRGQLQ